LFFGSRALTESVERNAMTTRETDNAGTLTLLADRATAARSHLEEWSDEAIRAVGKAPLRTLSLAVGVGFVLGGGMLSRLAFRVVGTSLGLGIRFGAVPLIAVALFGPTGEPDALHVGPAAGDTKERGIKPRRHNHEG
jgi:hypothetical protein